MATVIGPRTPNYRRRTNHNQRTMKIPLFPDQASTSASQVDALYLVLVGMSLCFLALIFLPIIYFLFKYRRGDTADRNPFRISTMKNEVTRRHVPLLRA